MQPNLKKSRLPKTKGKESFAGFRFMLDLKRYLPIYIGGFVYLSVKKRGFITLTFIQPII